VEKEGSQVVHQMTSVQEAEEKESKTHSSSLSPTVIEIVIAAYKSQKKAV
jgi:hypothetical protein